MIHERKKLSVITRRISDLIRRKKPIFEPMSKLFISRPIETNSPINYLVNKQITVISKSLIDISPVTVSQAEEDWIFFYSKKAISFYFEQGHKIQPHQRVACFGESTALHFEKLYQQTAEFIGTGDESATLALWQIKAVSGSICFMRGELSRRALIEELKDHHHISEKIIYQQQLKKVKLDQDYDLAIMTSPLNVQNFLANGGKADHYISIGATTATELLKYGISSKISSAPNEKAILEAVLEELDLAASH